VDVSANLVEIFSSVQGEGPEAGTSTLFVRFGECDLRCRWCDSIGTWRPAEACRVEQARGSGRFATWEEPVPIPRVVAALEKLEVEAHRWVSHTGGEPLLQPDAVGALARRLRGRGPGVLLETHGLHAEALAQVVDAVDLVSMDWKLVSDVRRASDRGPAEPAPFHDAHAAFLEVARRAPRVTVKIVVTPTSGDAEIDEALTRVARIHPAATLVLQPVTPAGAVKTPPDAARMLALGRRAETRLADVRVTPQMHPLLGVR
jgi:7-carboxy-7-deazaguanine synthase